MKPLLSTGAVATPVTAPGGQGRWQVLLRWPAGTHLGTVTILLQGALGWRCPPLLILSDGTLSGDKKSSQAHPRRETKTAGPAGI